jgi:hypothetical protein
MIPFQCKSEAITYFNTSMLLKTMLLCLGILACFLNSFSFRNGNTHASIFLAVLDQSFSMIPLNPDSVKLSVTFCFWTLKYRDVGL